MRKNLFFVHWTFIVCSMMILSCKKDATSSNKSSQNDSCKATIADAENIEIFPADNAWNQDVSALPVDPYSDQIIAGFATSSLKADFGSGLWNNAPIGIPFVVVCGNQQKAILLFVLTVMMAIMEMKAMQALMQFH